MCERRCVHEILSCICCGWLRSLGGSACAFKITLFNGNRKAHKAQPIFYVVIAIIVVTISIIAELHAHKSQLVFVCVNSALVFFSRSNSLCALLARFLLNFNFHHLRLEIALVCVFAEGCVFVDVRWELSVFQSAAIHHSTD